MMLLKLLARNAFRHRLRTALTVVGMAIAILAFGLLRTVIDAWYAGVEASAANRLITRNAISLIFDLPVAYRERIRQVDNVAGVSYGNWFGGYYKDPKNFFANFCVDLENFLPLYPELVLRQEQRDALLRDRKGVLVGRGLAERFGWKLGDQVSLVGTIFPGTWDMVVRGIYQGRDKTVDETLFYFHWAYVNESLRKTAPGRADRTGIFFVGIRDTDRAAETSKAVDALFKNSLAETLTETEKAFNLGFVAMSGAIITAIQAVSLVVIVIILAVVANTMAMSVRERRGEYAVLKTLGFGGGFVAALIVGESLLITCLGGGLGMALTFPASAAFASYVKQFFPIFVVSRETLALGTAASLAVGLLAALQPAVSAVRVPIAEALRRID